MPSLIDSGDASNGVILNRDTDGALTIRTGPAGGKVNALALDSSGNGALLGTLTQAGVATPRLVLGTAQNTTSGANIDFIGIPSWAKRITVMFNGVSTSGTSNWQIQVGTSGGFLSSGYAGSAANQVGTGANNSAGFLVNVTVAATDVMWGQATLLKTTGAANQIQCTGILANNTAANLRYFGGAVTPADVVDRIRITTANGTDTFDSGSVNILIEG